MVWFKLLATLIFWNIAHHNEWRIYILVKLGRAHNSNCLRKQLLIRPMCMLIYTWQECSLCWMRLLKHSHILEDISCCQTSSHRPRDIALRLQFKLTTTLIFFYLTVLFYHSFFRMGLIPPKENLGMTGVSFYRLDTFLSYNLQCQSTEWQITINSFAANVDKSWP